MTYYDLSKSTKQERLRWAQLVEPARRAVGWTQQELAEASGVDRKSVSNMEGGALSPQPDKLRAVFAALGIPTELDRFPEEIEDWQMMFGRLLMGVPEDLRKDAADRSLGVLLRFDVGGNRQDRVAQVTRLTPKQQAAAAMTPDELETLKAAATRDAEMDTPEPPEV